RSTRLAAATIGPIVIPRSSSAAAFAAGRSTAQATRLALIRRAIRSLRATWPPRCFGGSVATRPRKPTTAPDGPIAWRRDSPYGAEEGEMFVGQVWIDDNRVWGPNILPRSLNSPLGPPAAHLYADPYIAVATALKERKLDGGTIGVEKHFLSVDAFEKLQRGL